MVEGFGTADDLEEHRINTELRADYPSQSPKGSFFAERKERSIQLSYSTARIGKQTNLHHLSVIPHHHSTPSFHIIIWGQFSSTRNKERRRDEEKRRKNKHQGEGKKEKREDEDEKRDENNRDERRKVVLHSSPKFVPLM